ncbi:winged helix-turn-helix transcriptional regulator [Mesonia aestuariivivens]|uniref:Helix-turn-helix transcriptional regulator n=1 Tax=Mesonia aestuariivivens TaxID=2796128 RepID=A0ABS6W3E4_9FLAO|nr:helix-turn-helix domain-containing protein [Mesonia aestuariivivens]MBW2962334.1 helix-turn-helix transcriptional regulator [Mesonia aestuariivivens]
MKKDLTSKVCKKNILAVRDSLEVLNGKWKLPIIITLQDGPFGFNELEKSIDGITPKLLSKSLKDLEMNGFVKREVIKGSPIQVHYSLTNYSGSLDQIIDALRDWGLQHRKHIIEQ